MTMSSTNVSKLTNNVNIRTECLVFGYIRNIHILNQIIPSSIIFLCIKFYNNLLRIIFIKQAAYGWSELDYSFPEIRISEFEQNKYYKCNILQLDNKKHSGREIENTGICYVKDFNLSNKILSLNNPYLNERDIYDTIFVIGNGDGRLECDQYIINQTEYYSKIDNINIYHYKLPNGINSIQGGYAIYSNNYGLLSICKQIDYLSFNNNDNDNDNLQWKKLCNYEKSRSRRYTAAAMINDINV